MTVQRTINSLMVLGLCSLANLANAHEPSAAEQVLQLDEAALGSVNFENSCSDEVQSAFNRGVALLHSFLVFCRD